VQTHGRPVEANLGGEDTHDGERRQDAGQRKATAYTEWHPEPNPPGPAPQGIRVCRPEVVASRMTAAHTIRQAAARRVGPAPLVRRGPDTRTGGPDRGPTRPSGGVFRQGHRA